MRIGSLHGKYVGLVSELSFTTSSKEGFVEIGYLYNNKYRRRPMSRYHDTRLHGDGKVHVLTQCSEK